MSEQDGTQKTALQSPTNDDKEAWKAYWQAQNQPWRTEPEISAERQKYLEERGNIKPDIEQGIYPFKDIELSRADIEWLLVTHENGRGPVDWTDDKSLYERKGLDLRGADLRQMNLRHLPLARIYGGLGWEEWLEATEKQRNMAAVHMEEADLTGAYLNSAYLSGAYLCRADFSASHLEEVRLRFAYLEGACFRFAHLERAHLRGANLEGADLSDAFLDGVRLENVNLSNRKLTGPRMVDANWGSANLSVVKWSQLEMLGDEYEAQQKERDGKMKDNVTRLTDYIAAVRANRQLAVALQAQGINEIAAHFAYRAQKLQQAVFLRQRKFGAYLFSLLLDLLTGYGYKPLRSFQAYLLVITAFASAYFIIGHTVGPSLSLVGSVVFSMTSFHGRGFFPGGIALDDPLTILAALEAFVGLLIEVTFIATLTQRLFGK